MMNRIKNEFPIIAALILILIQILFALITNLLTKKEGMEWIFIDVILYFIAFLIFIAMLKFFIKFIKSTMSIEKIVGLTGKPEKKYKGLIVLCSVGKGISSAEDAIKYHYEKLEICWLVTGGEESKKSADDMIKKLGYSEKLFNFIEISPQDANDPYKVYKKIEDKIYNKLPEGIKESDIIGDYTGGTKSMTAGLMLACLSPSRNFQFIKPNEVDNNGYAIHNKGTEPMEVNINFKIKQVKTAK